VLGYKFDEQAAPHMILVKAFNEFFGKWGRSSDDGKQSDLDPSMRNSSWKICRGIFAALDDEGFCQLCCLVPNFAKMFSLLATSTEGRRDEENVISSMDKVGSTKERLRSLFNVLIESICSAGCPVLFAFDDLQRSESFVSEVIAEFALYRIHDGTTGVSGKVRRRGLLIAGAYRSNEFRKDGDLV